jgi:CBS domain-containing protein
MGLEHEINSAVQWDTPKVEMQDTLRTAITRIARGMVSALIVKNEGQVVGIFTDMDLMGCIARGEDLDRITVSNFMTSCEIISGKTIKSPCVQLDETQSVKNALGVMDLAGIRHLLVTGERGVGIVSVHDLLRLVVE